MDSGMANPQENAFPTLGLVFWFAPLSLHPYQLPSNSEVPSIRGEHSMKTLVSESLGDLDVALYPDEWVRVSLGKDLESLPLCVCATVCT